MASLGECPPTLRPISHYLKLALEHDTRDPVVSYWARLYALQTGLKLSQKGQTEQMFLIGIMDFLEAYKKNEGKDNEAIQHEVVAQAHLENYALKLFQYADKNDRSAVFNKNIVKAFFSAGQIYDVLQTFGELTDEAAQNRKYAKWKAAYIHTCLKNGETPVPGQIATEGDEEFQGGAPAPPTTNQETPQEGAAGGGWYQPPAPETGAWFQPPTPQPAPPSQPDAFDPLVLNRAPSPPKEPEKSPGGFKAFSDSTPVPAYYPTSAQTQTLPPEMMNTAQKYCKYAVSALNYDDIPEAVMNLQKALRLLQTGQDS